MQPGRPSTGGDLRRQEHLSLRPRRRPTRAGDGHHRQQPGGARGVQSRRDGTDHRRPRPVDLGRA
nr:hypothetical protein [Gordonia mangrovi]